MVYRVYVEKKVGLDNEARALLSDLRTLLGMTELQKVIAIHDCLTDTMLKTLTKHFLTDASRQFFQSRSLISVQMK